MPKPSRRGSEPARLSGRRRQELRNLYMYQHPLCERCEARGLLVASAELHHRVQLAKGGDHSWENLEALCVECHLDASRAERGAKPKGATVDGVPTDPNHWWNRK